MLLSSLVDASRGSGSAVEMAVLDAIGALHDVAQPDGSPGLSGVTVTFEPTQRCGVRSTWMNAVMSAHEHGHGDHDHDHNHDSHDHDHRPDMHRPARDVLAMIRAADLPETVIEWATAVYSRLAEVEGALASVVGGLTAAPVVAIPTSVGYGSGLDGVTALLAMHASCASGVTVVGVDNGFGAAVAVVRMLTLGL